MNKDDQIMVIGLGILGYERISNYKKTGKDYTPVLEGEVIEKYQNNVLFHNVIDTIINFLT